LGHTGWGRDGLTAIVSARERQRSTFNRFDPGVFRISAMRGWILSLDKTISPARTSWPYRNSPQSSSTSAQPAGMSRRFRTCSGRSTLSEPDRLQNEFERALHHPIPYRRNLRAGGPSHRRSEARLGPLPHAHRVSGSPRVRRIRGMPVTRDKADHERLYSNHLAEAARAGRDAGRYTAAGCASPGIRACRRVNPARGVAA